MIGQTISHYKITEKLGEGGMGVVYKAEDTKLKRTVTLKFIRTQAMEAAEEKTRFVREAQAAAALDHPNICTIYEIDEVKGKTFIAMAYIKGQSLNIKVKSAPMKLKEVLDIGMQVAQGLQEAHEKGVFHRDIKSSNIMVTEKGQAKIMDFGIAKLTGGTEITRPATFMGTVTYMSPEQASAEPLDHRTDIWSLGVVLYEMLTGQTPFKGEHEQVILHSILNKNPEPITSLRSGIPLEIEAIVNKCLEKDSTERYQTAADLIADLKRLDRDMTTGKTVIPAATATYPAATAALPRAFLRLLRKIAIPLSGVILVLSLLFLLPSVRQAVKKWLGFKAMPEEMGLAVLPFTIVSGDSEDQAICEGLVEILTSKLTQLERFQESLWVVAASEVRENRITSPSRARRTLGVTLVVTESWQHIGDEVILTLNLIDTKTLRILRSRDIKVPITNISTLQDDVVFRLVDMLDVELKPQTRRVLTAGGTTVPDAYEFYLLGRGYLLRSDNEESLASAIGLFDQAIEKDSSYALAYAGLGEAYWLKWKLTKNQELTKMAQSYCERAIQLSESLAPVRVTLGIIYRDTSKYEDAIKEFKQALLLDPVSFDAHQELALTYQKLGRPEEAEDTYKRAIELKPDYWSGYSHLGVFYLKHARYEEAEEMFRNVTELTPDNPENALGYNNLGASYLYMGRFNDAIAVFKKSIAIHPSPEACSNLGTLYFFQSRYTDAMDMYEKAIDLGKKDYTIWGNLADAYRYIPEYSEKAREAYQRAIQLAEELLAINPRDSELHGKLARYYAILEDHEKALAEISKARELTPSNVRVLFNSILVSELANQRDQAIQALQEYIERGGSMEKVRGDPDLSELRKDPRYKQLIKKEGSGVFDSPKINK